MGLDADQVGVLNGEWLGRARQHEQYHSATGVKVPDNQMKALETLDILTHSAFHG